MLIAKFRSAVLAAAIALAPVAGEAAVFDVVGGFSTTLNPNGPYTYGYVVGGAFTAFDTTTWACAGISGLTCHYATGFQNNNLPAVGINTTGSLISTGTVRIPTDQLFFHPVGLNAGLPGGDAVLRFTAPSAGVYDVTAIYQLLDTSPSGVEVGVESGAVGTTSILSGALNDTTTITTRFSLMAGDVIDFAVGSAGSYFNDSTGLRAQISVPEPASLALFGAGLLGIGIAKRRRR